MQALVDGVERQLQAVGDAQFVEDVVQMSILNGPILPGQADQGGVTSLGPVLQAENGSFVGSVWNLNYNQQYNLWLLSSRAATSS
jgi:hypothetical protein